MFHITYPKMFCVEGFCTFCCRFVAVQRPKLGAQNHHRLSSALAMQPHQTAPTDLTGHLTNPQTLNQRQWSSQSKGPLMKPNSSTCLPNPNPQNTKKVEVSKFLWNTSHSKLEEGSSCIHCSSPPLYSKTYPPSHKLTSEWRWNVNGRHLLCCASCIAVINQFFVNPYMNPPTTLQSLQEANAVAACSKAICGSKAKCFEDACKQQA